MILRFATTIIWLYAAALDAADVSYAALTASASEHSHRLNIRAIDTRIEQTKLDSIRSVYYPQLSFGYNAEYNRNLDPAASGSLMVGDMMINSSVPYKHSGVLRMNYELYRFGATDKQVEAAEKEVAIKRLDVCDEEIRLHREILDRYADALSAQNERGYKRRLLELHTHLYGLKQRLYDAGKESRIAIGEEAIRLIDLERDIERARIRFEENIVALSNLSHIALDSADTRLMPLSHEVISNTPQLSFFQTPQSRAYEDKLLKKESELEVLRRSQLPVVSLYSSYYLYGSDTDSFYNGFEAVRPNSWNVGISLRWSLFEGFKYNAESARLKLERDRIREEADLAKREFDHDTRTMQEKINRLERVRSSDQSAVDETQKRLIMTQRLREQGEADAASEMNVNIERLEREMTLAAETITQEVESEKLRLRHRGVDTCTPR